MSSVETVLLVDDTRSDALLYSALLRRAAGTPRSVEHASTLEEALALLGKRDYDAVLLDLGLPDSDGLGGIRRIAGVAPRELDAARGEERRHALVPLLAVYVREVVLLRVGPVAGVLSQVGSEERPPGAHVHFSGGRDDPL